MRLIQGLCVVGLIYGLLSSNFVMFVLCLVFLIAVTTLDRD